MRVAPPQTVDDLQQVDNMLSAIVAAHGVPDYHLWLKIVSAIWSKFSFEETIGIIEKHMPEEETGEYERKYKSRLIDIGFGTLIHIARECGHHYTGTYTPQPGRNEVKKGFKIYKSTSCQPEQFTTREYFSGGTVCRLSRKFIESSELPDAYDEQATGAYCSIYRHLPELETYCRDNGNSLAGYTDKPVYLHPLQIDIDHDGDLEAARRYTCELARLPRFEFRPYFSGGKGFRLISRNTNIIRPLNCRPDTPELIKAFVKSVIQKTGLPLKYSAVDKNGKPVEKYIVDLNIYSTTHVIRIPNSRHEKSGRFMIPLTVDELERLTVEEIRSMAQQPRRLFGGEYQPKRGYSRALDQYFTVHENGNVYTVEFDDHTVYSKRELYGLKGEQPEDIRFLHHAKKLFNGDLERVV